MRMRRLPPGDASMIRPLSLCLVAAVLLAAAPAAPPNGSIEQAMKQMSDALKVLEKGVSADNHAAALDELSKFETALVAAKGQTPDSAAKVEEKKRAAYVADFRKTLVATLRLALDAEAAIADGKYKDADALIRNKLSAQKSAGHSKFKPEGK
jgi:Cytochrome b562